mgnify:CR=1 FL=1
MDKDISVFDKQIRGILTNTLVLKWNEIERFALERDGIDLKNASEEDRLCHSYTHIPGYCFANNFKRQNHEKHCFGWALIDAIAIKPSSGIYILKFRI